MRRFHSIINKPKKASIGAGFRLRKSTDAMIDTIARIPMPMLDWCAVEEGDITPSS